MIWAFTVIRFMAMGLNREREGRATRPQFHPKRQKFLLSHEKKCLLARAQHAHKDDAQRRRRGQTARRRDQASRCERSRWEDFGALCTHLTRRDENNLYVCVCEQKTELTVDEEQKKMKNAKHATLFSATSQLPSYTRHSPTDPFEQTERAQVKFGVLFADDRCANIFEALVGTLRAGKKRKVRHVWFRFFLGILFHFSLPLRKTDNGALSPPPYFSPPTGDSLRGGDASSRGSRSRGRRAIRRLKTCVCI